MNFTKTIPLFLLLGLSACANTEPLNVTYTPVKMEINHPPNPAPVVVNAVNFRVITKDNFQSFINSQIKIQNSTNPVFIVFTTNDYKAMSLNLAELKRYIVQQHKIIAYYKAATTESK